MKVDTGIFLHLGFCVPTVQPHIMLQAVLDMSVCAQSRISPGSNYQEKDKNTPTI